MINQITSSVGCGLNVVKQPTQQTGLTPIKIVILGACSVGKSCLALQYVHNEFLRHDPTIEDTYRKYFLMDGNNVILDIVDTAGLEEFSRSMMGGWINDGEAFMLVYDITSKQSLEDAERIRNQIRQSKTKSRGPLILVGNKSDLGPSKREVESDEGEAKALSWDCPFLETSAKEGDNVDKAFEELTKLCLTYREKEKSVGKRKRKIRCVVL